MNCAQIVRVFALLLVVITVAAQAASAGRKMSKLQQISGSIYARLLRDFGVFRRQLQEEGHINSIDQQLVFGAAEGAGDDAAAATTTVYRINELDMLQLIPVLIDEVRADRISAVDGRMLHTLYGPLWELMVDKAHNSRQTFEPTDDDAILMELLRALRQLDAEAGGNSKLSRAAAAAVAGSSALPMRRIDERFAKLWNRSNEGGVEDTPSQRILKLAAILIQAHKGIREA